MTYEVAVGVRGGVFSPETTLDFLVTSQTRPDPDPTPTTDLNFISCPPFDPLRPDLTLESADAPCWALFIS